MAGGRGVTGRSLSLRDVTKCYGALAAIDGVSFDIAAGSFVALVGTSGSGKSTLLKTINQLVEPDSGRILLDGEPVNDGPAYLLRRRIGYMFQNTGLFPHMSVADNIGIGLRLRGVADRSARIAEMLALVGLDGGLAGRMPAELSGGQSQRVGVARALAPAPGLLLMDEPFGALDPVTRDALGRETRALHDRLGLMSLLVTHDIAEALLLADRVLVMERGALVGDATPRELLNGGGGAAAQALVAVPRAQAARLAAMYEDQR